MKVFDAHCHIYPAKIARKAAQTEKHPQRPVGADGKAGVQGGNQLIDQHAAGGGDKRA